MAGRKRVYAMPMSNSNRSYKKRKNNRRRRGRRGSKNVSSTSKSGRGLSIGFKSRKVSRNRWNNLLWTSTLQKTHYRSLNAIYNTIATPISSSLMTVFSQPAMRLVNNFYVGAGGAVPVNTGVPVPVFDGDIILRGGLLKLLMVNDAAGVEAIQVKLFLIKTGDAYVAANVPVGPILYGWDPSLIPEFNKNVGRILIQREFMLENGASAEFVHRLKIQKIDTVEYVQDVKSYLWIVLAGNMSAGGPQGLSITRSLNLSFSGDAV